MKKNIKIIIVIIIIAIVIVSIYFGYDYYKQEKRKADLNIFKKEFFNSVLCEYNCPLKEQEVKNKTQLLPTVECLSGCSYILKEKYGKNDFTKEEISSDGLIKDMNASKSPCIKDSFNQSSFKLDNEKYFNCASENLAKLKDKYNYLK